MVDRDLLIAKMLRMGTDYNLVTLTAKLLSYTSVIFGNEEIKTHLGVP